MSFIVEAVNDVIDWVVDEVINPVVDGIGDVINYVLDNPIEAIAKIGLTVVSGGAYAWAIPLVDGAATLAKGGDLGDALKAAAISYAGAKVGTVASKYVGNVASDYLGDSLSSQIISAGITSGTKSAATALVYGQDPLKAFASGGIQGALGATLGKIDDAMEGQFEDLQDGVKDSIQAGVAGALGDGNISAETVGSIVTTYSGVGDFMTKFLQENTGMSNTAANVITTAVSNSVATALAGNPDLSGDAFFQTMSEAGAETLKRVIDKPVNDAIDKLSGAYGNTEVAADALNNATTKAGQFADEFNRLQGDLNGKIEEQDRLKTAYNNALDKYNGNKTEANANAVNAAAKAFNDYATNLEKDYNDNYKTQLETAKNNFDFWNNQIPDLEDDYNDARDWMVTTGDELSVNLKPVMDAADRAVALLLNNTIDEEAYREMYGLSDDETVYGHFLANQPDAVTLDPNLNANSTALGGDTYYEADTDTIYERVNGKWQKVDRQTAPSLNDYVKLTLGEDYSYDTSDGKFYVETPDGRQQVNPYVEANEVSTTYDAPSMADMRAGTRAVGFTDRITSDMSRILESAGYEAPEGGVVMLDHFKALRDAGYNINPYKDPGTGVVIDGTKDFDAIKEEIVMDQTVYDPEQFLMSQPVLYSGNTLTFDGTTPVNAEIRQIFRDAGYSDAEVEYYAPVGGMVDLEGAAPTPDLVDAMYEAEYYPPDYDTMMTIAANVYGKETGTDKFMRNTSGLTLRSLGDLAATMGYVSILTNKAGWTDIDPTNNAMSRFGEGLEKLGMAAHTDEYKQALSEFEKDMEKRLGEAEGAWETVQTIAGSAVSNPGMFFSEYIMSEVIQEAPALLLSGGTITVAKAGLKATAKNMGEEAAEQLARRVGFGAGVAADVAEAYAGAASGAYNTAYQVYLDTQVPIEMREGGLSREEAIRVLTPLAEQYATKQAEDMGALGAITMVALSGYGNALERKLFKNADEATQGFLNTLADGTTAIYDVTKKETISEFFEEAIPAGALEARLALLDPNRDASGEVAAAGMFGAVSGGGTGSVISTGNELIRLTGNLGADFAQLSNSDVRDAVQNSSNPQALTNALANLGLTDAKSVAALGNQVMPDQFTDENEVRRTIDDAVQYNIAESVKLGGPELTFTSEQIDDLIDTYVGSSDTSLNFEDSIYDMVDKNYVSIQEVKDAAAAEGITLTDEQAAELTGQGNEEELLSDIREQYDPQYTSASEAISMLRDLGFDTRGPHRGLFGAFKNLGWRTTLASQFEGKTEAEALEALKAYADPRMVTEDEARAMLEAEGYTPTQAEVDALVGQGYNESYQADAEAGAPAYVDPRQVTEAEARAFFADQGYDPTDEEVAELVGQGNANFEADVAADVPAYVDPRQVTEAEARAALEAEGYTPTDVEVAEYTGQGDANFQATQEQAATSYADPRTMSEAEARALFEAQGYEPTDAEVAELVGQGGENYESDTGAGVPAYVDPRQTTEAEARAMFAAQGYDPTDEEVAAYIGQGDENFQSNKETAVGNYVDPRQTTTAEVKKAFSDAGYTATDEQVEQFVGQLNEAQQLAAVGDYIDPRQVTESEVKKFFEDLGYEATADEIAANVGQSLEATYQDTVGTDVGAYVNPRQVTEAEAKAYFDSIGYEANAAEIASFTGQGGDTFAADQEAAVGTYVDPRQMTEAEVRAMFAAQGYNPTDDEVAEYIGQGDRNFEVNTSTNVTNYADPRATTEAEVRAAFEATGYQPSDEEVAARVGQGNADFESAANTEIPTYADPRLVTEAEARAFFDGLGYEATDQEVADFMGQVEDATNSQYQTQQENKVGQYVDPRQVTMDELQEIADAENLTLTEALAEAYLGQGDSNFESTSLADARAEYDPLATTTDEARSFFDSLGYTYTDDEVTQFANDSVSEAEQQAAVGSYVDPRQFTFDEAKQYMIDQGYVDPTDEEVNAYVGQGDDTFQTLGQEAAYKYVDDFTVTADEVRDMYRARGLQRPTDEDIQRFVGQYEEATLEDQIIEYMPIATSNSINGIVEGLEDKIGNIATGDEPATGLYGYIDEAIQELKDAGLDVEAVEGVINDVVGTPATDDADATGIYAALEDVVTDVDSVIGRPATEDSEATGIYSAIDSAVAGVSEDVAGVAEDVTNLSEIIGTPAIEDDLATTDVDESQPATGLMGDIADLEAAGNTRDEAIAKLSEDLGIAYEDLAGAIGTPAVADDPNTVDVDESQPATGVYAALGDIETGLAEDIAGVAGDVAEVAGDVADVAAILGKPAVLDDPNTEINESQDPTGIFATIDAYEKAGMERDEALELAIGEVASALGTTETNILAELGVTKTDILGELETGLGALEESLGGDIDAIASIIGKPAQEVTQVDIDFVADVIAQSQVLDEIQTAQYDVTGDGIVDINDQNLLTSALQGEDVTFADTSMFGPATGIYGTISDVQQDLQSNLDTQTETITDILTDITTQIQTGQDQQKAANMLQMLSQPGMLQQDVSVKMPDPLQLRYTYDISGPSIFATPGQAQMFVSPFGGSRATPANMTAVPQALGPSTAMTGMMPRAAGFAEGGVVDETDALLALLGDMD